MDDFIDGTVEVGDEVKTLHLKRAICGKVTYISKRGRANVVGNHYLGGPQQKCTAHVENLGIITKGQTCERKGRERVAVWPLT